MSGRRDKSKSKSKSRERRGQCFLCGRDSKQVCPACQRVHFCSQDHFFSHRQQNYCFPYKVVWRSGKGRALVATRNIEALELILFDGAIVTGPRNSQRAVCLECGEDVDGNYLCGLCNMPLCGESCQVGKIHSSECSMFREFSQRINLKSLSEEDANIYPFITPLRLLMKKQTSPRAFRRLHFLMDHREERDQEISQWSEEKKKVMNTLLQCSGIPDVTEDDIYWAIGILQTNSIMFGDASGRALFPLFSFMNHSCAANAKHTLYIPNRRISVQAQTDIEEGEEISINYVSFIHGTRFRREKLEKHWHFLCSCRRCQDPTELGSHLSSLVCDKCEKGKGYLMQVNPLDRNSPWRCSNKHTFTISAENVVQLVQDMKTKLFSVPKDVKEMEKLLEEYAPYLHQQHTINMIAKRNIISQYSRLPLKSVGKQDFLRIKELCEESIQVLGKVDPGYPLWKSESLKDLSTCQLNLARTDFEDGSIARPEFLERVKAAMKLVEQASKCKSCVKVERRMEDGSTVSEELSSI